MLIPQEKFQGVLGSKSSPKQKMLGVAEVIGVDEKAPGALDSLWSGVHVLLS